LGVSLAELLTGPRRRLTPRLAIATIAAVAASGLPVAVAHAAYTPAALVSYEGEDQAQDAYDPAISADGRYVAFTGTFNGVSGVYRKELPNGGLTLVAGTDSSEPALSAPDAGSPSISENGQYVSFTTTAHLDGAEDQPGEDGGCSSVYVRNMDLAPGEPGAYILASALNDSTQGIAYAGGATSGCPGGGSAAADRVALSVRTEGPEEIIKVAFTVLGSSNLTTGPGGATTTPPDQIAVRDLNTDTTTLVSQTASSLGATPEAVPGGAALGPLRVNLQAYNDGREISGSSAAISADGSTVAWMGVDIPAQAPASSQDGGNEYAEPLWRRIGEGPDAPTRRVTGGDDPLCGCAGPLETSFVSANEQSGGNPGEPLGGTYAEPGGFGADPLGGGASLDSVTPQLSADGQVVAILSNKPRTGEVSRALEEEGYPSTANAYVVNMATGLSRSAALTQLTEWGSDNFHDSAATDGIEGIAISPDGTKVAFTTGRIEFPLSPPALITPALGQAVHPQLYVADLSAETLQLVSYGYGGEPANDNVATPSFTGNGETLAFASSATNLVYGAFNRGGADGAGPGDVFVTSQISSPAVAGVTYISPPPPAPVAAQPREILLATQPGSNGSVLLYVTVPGAGSLKALAKAEVPETVTVSTPAKGKRGKGKAKTQRAVAGSAAKRSRQAKRTTVVSKTVASASAKPSQAGMVQLRLTPASAERALEESHDGLYATITVTFAVPGSATLTGTVQVTFKRAAPKPAKKKTATDKTSAKKSAKGESERTTAKQTTARTGT
jgi:Tol biopolymer transport system component